MKKIISFALAAVVVLTFSVPTLAVPDKDGWFSTPVLEEGTTWLTVDFIDTYSGNGSAAIFRTYFGIMNGVILATGKPLFEPGSTFSVRILPQDSFEYNEAFDNLDDPIRKKAGKNIMFFEAKITKADGVTEYTNLRELSDLIIRGSYGVVEVCRETDVNIMTIEKELPLGWLDSPEEGEYTFCMLDHLGQVYALLSANDDSFFPYLSEDLGIYEGYPIGSTISDGHSAIITGIIGIAAGMAIMFFIMRKKTAAIKDSTGEK